jgi:hypothetical protein
MNEMKQCFKCKDWFPKDTDHFRRNCNKSDGFDNYCKPCRSEWNRLPHRRAGNTIRHRRYVQSEKGRLKARRLEQKYQRENKHLNHAHNAVLRAIKRGGLPRPTTLFCADCGLQAQEYHHWSYEPKHFLDVIPLCKDCHNSRHHG